MTRTSRHLTACTRNASLHLKPETAQLRDRLRASCNTGSAKAGSRERMCLAPQIVCRPEGIDADLCFSICPNRGSLRLPAHQEGDFQETLLLSQSRANVFSHSQDPPRRRGVIAAVEITLIFSEGGHRFLM